MAKFAEDFTQSSPVTSKGAIVSEGLMLTGQSLVCLLLFFATGNGYSSKCMWLGQQGHSDILVGKEIQDVTNAPTVHSV